MSHRPQADLPDRIMASALCVALLVPAWIAANVDGLLALVLGAIVCAVLLGVAAYLFWVLATTGGSRPDGSPPAGKRRNARR